MWMHAQWVLSMLTGIRSSLSRKMFATGGPVGPTPYSGVGIDVALEGVIVMGLEQRWEEEGGVDMPSCIWDLEQPGSLGLPVAV
jgi:hypothetical protein